MIDKGKLTAALDELCTLLEIDGANTFRSGAHDKAARALRDFTGDLDALAAEGKLTSIDGIGKGIAEKIMEFRDSGKITELEELRARIPAGLVQMVCIPGFGAKKARTAWLELSVTDIAELEKACADGRLAGLKGFGAKSAEKVLHGIAHLRKFAGRYRIDVARAAAAPILEKLRAHKAVKRAEIAGSLRRWKETIGDLDFVVSTSDPEAVMEFFVTLPGVESVDQQGETKSSIILEGGLQADIRCVSEAEFPYALMHFTGSKEHNTRMRARAKDRGLKLNEYGLFPEDSEKPLPAKDEAAIYKHLELVYIAPELREDRGEMEAAEKNALPKLLERADLRGLLHMHTHYSDGKPAVADYAAWAKQHGYQWMGIADHSKSLAIARGLDEERVRQQQAEIDAANKEYAKDGIRLLKGVECDILVDGSLDYDEEFRACFEFIVASVHTHFNLTEAEQTRRICRALEHPHTTVLGHMSGRLLQQRDPYPCDQKEIIRTAGRNNVAIEINASPWRLDVDWRLLGFALEQGCKITIGPDAHFITGLDDTEYGIAMARKGWVEAKDILNCLSAEEFLQFARRKK